MKGLPANIPMWAAVINMSESYKIPPWQFWNECTEEWWERMKIYNKARSDA